MDDIEKVIGSISPLNMAAKDRAHSRLQNLTKPEGSLGRLETLAEHLAAIQGEEIPQVKERAVIVFAADHGVTEEGISAYPKEVTKAMVENFLNGGAAISVLSKLAGARLYVVDVGVAAPARGEGGGLMERKVAMGTRNLAKGPAMTYDEARRSVSIGMEAAARAIADGAKAIALGDMGIGNTTSASAVICAITGRAAGNIVGRGTGVDDPTFKRKVSIVKTAVSKIQEGAGPWKVMEAVGGFEIAAIAGASLLAASKRCPVVVDGLISAAGALWATTLSNKVKGYLVPSHLSVEPGHKAALDALGLEPYLDLSMRLGEGTGSALCLLLCDASCRLIDEMATFEEAEVARKER